MAEWLDGILNDPISRHIWALGLLCAFTLCLIGLFAIPSLEEWLWNRKVNRLSREKNGGGRRRRDRSRDVGH